MRRGNKMSKIEQSFANWSSSPSMTIKHILSELDCTIEDLSHDVGPEILPVIYENSPITEDLAYRISHHLGGTAEFWVKRDKQFRKQISGTEPIDENVWIKDIKYADLANLDWVPKTRKSDEKIENVLDYFDCDTVEEWKFRYKNILDSIAFRTTNSFENCGPSTIAWLRRGEQVTDTDTLPKFDSSALEKSVPELKKLCKISDPNVFLPKLKKTCGQSGVGLAVVKAPKGCKASGATRFLTNQRAILQLSFRYLSDDHFWFTIFHEIGHLILHEKAPLFLEGSFNEIDDFENDANEFSFDVLIEKKYRDDIATVKISAKPIIKLAYKIGISPGILVGQMQNMELIERSKMNFLKRRYQWDNIASL